FRKFTAEDLPHLFGRPDVIFGFGIPGAVKRSAFANADKDIASPGVIACQVMSIVGRDERNSAFLRKDRCFLHKLLVGGGAMVLDLKIEIIFAKDGAKRGSMDVGRFAIAIGQKMADRTISPARKSYQTGTLFRKNFQVDPWFVMKALG